jgi:hypothetical protein
MPLVPLDPRHEQRSQARHEKHDKNITRICEKIRKADRCPDIELRELIDGEMQTLNKIIRIDTVKYSALVEPNVTMETLVRESLLHCLIPSVVADSRAVPVGDAFAAITTGSSSFQFGTFGNAVVAIEIVQSDGQCVSARIDDPSTSHLIIQSTGVPKSNNRTTLLEIVLRKAGPYVNIRHLHMSSVDAVMQGLQTALQSSSVDFDFVEGIMSGANHGRVTFGQFTPIQHITKSDFETIPTIEYLFRNGDDDLRTQDIGIPTKGIANYIKKIHAQHGLWPIRVYPLRSSQYLHGCWNISFHSSSPVCDSSFRSKLSEMEGFRYLQCRDGKTEKGKVAFVHFHSWDERSNLSQQEGMVMT